ncbi:MAG: hypothetical protein M0C28_40205 [Candidatus Moduliflexus flocculans]|nr:hypothetical protein [Candidatus Moduliflexus flocculans]
MACFRRFGGGIELTTLAAIPGGSGLGTSSIMGRCSCRSSAGWSGGRSPPASSFMPS